MATMLHIQGRMATNGPHVGFLRDLFQKFDQNGIRYCVFRDYDKLTDFEPEKEIDLLVDRRDLDELRGVLNVLDFVETPSWGHDPHRFFVGYFKDIRMWLKLDVVTALRFGKPVSSLGLDLGQDVLEHCVHRDIASTLSPEDEFFVLVAKSIVNDCGFTESRLQRLHELYSEIDATPGARGRLKNRLESGMGDALPFEELVDRFAREDWSWFIAQRREIVSSLFRRQAIRTIGRHLGILLKKRISPLLCVLRQRGTSVALLAPDGAGKSTLAQSLISQRHLHPRLIYMGTNIAASNVGFPTTAWIRAQKNGPGKNQFAWIVARALSFPNRLLEQWYRSAIGIYHILRGRTVIYDRYIYDSWINPRATTPMKRLRRFLVERTCPATDLVILLDAPGEVLFARKREHTPESLEQKRQSYLELRDRLENLVVVDATQNAQAVQDEVISILWAYYGRRKSERELHGRSAPHG